MSVILAIKPKYATLILSGEKKIELRKKLWNEKKQIQKAYLYASSPVKKIVGYIEIDHIYKETIQFLWTISRTLSCLSKEEFDTYYSGYSHGSAILIKRFKKFKSPVDPMNLDPEFKAPQNFCYAKELESKLNEIEVE